MIEATTKRCRKCDTVKSTEDFARDRKASDGLRSWCRPCSNARKKEWRQADPEREREATRRWRAKNPEARIVWYWRDVARNPEKRAAREKLKTALRAGRLVRALECEMCGAGGLLHGHHDDYSKPLAVRWLCPMCHRKADDALARFGGAGRPETQEENR